ncbi:MAG TPA: signal peptidase II [Pyrinomonadaceae bacterium]|nr:signal peptidase II [Pyrinomonadaceae bacterium]
MSGSRSSESNRDAGGQRRNLVWRALYLVAAAGVYLTDQASKAWAVRELRFGNTRTVIDGVFYFSYAENPGIAFEQLQGGGQFGRWMLSTLAALAAVGVVLYLFRTTRTDDRVLGACALLLAGIAGNLTDRVRLGHVIDFIEVHIGSFQWPTFNVADAVICVGAGLLALDLFLEGKREREKGERGEAERAAS